MIVMQNGSSPRALPSSDVVLGIRHNWRQFALLMATNAFVGGMAGLERSIVPLIGQSEFHLDSKLAILSFIATFGLSKALANLAVGRLSSRVSRKGILIMGWVIGLPVPFMLMWASSWNIVLLANLLLGFNQGLTWSMTVNMKIDLAGPRQRGLALGLNEMTGYLALAAGAFATGIIADQYGLRPQPFYLGIGLAAAGLAFSVLLVRDTADFVKKEMEISSVGSIAGENRSSSRAFAITQAGFINNLNDALIWGVIPLYLVSRGLTIEQIAVIAALYPLVWAVLQVFTGWLSDGIGRKPLIVAGMIIQGLAIAGFTFADSYATFLIIASILGLGTAMVYPVLLAAIGDTSSPASRSSHLARYRFWRDIGFVAGAVSAGVFADIFGIRPAINMVAILTIASGIIAACFIAQRPGVLRDTKIRSVAHGGMR